jgi:GNAT superfamily N-acetyltransferase
MDEIGTTLWRVRTVLTDRPGALARLAGTCGEAGVNILALQIFPDVGSVTDELVLSTPSDWTVRRVQELMLEAGADSSKGAPQVSQAPPSSLTDQPVRHLHAVARLVEEPDRLGEVAAALFEGRVATAAGPAHDGALDLRTSGRPVRIVRDAPFTATERARASVLEMVAELVREGASVPDPTTGTGVPVVRVEHDRVLAEVDGHVVGKALLTREPEGAGVRVHVVPAWRGRGLGARLLREVCALGRTRGESALVARVPAHDVAALRLLLGSGLCGRIRSDGGETVARLVVGQLTTA